MKVLVYCATASAAPIVSALGSLGSIDVAHTVESALARLGRTPADAVLVEWRPHDPPTILIAMLKERFPTIGIVALIDAPTAPLIDAIEAAGVHDIQRKPVFARELAFRFDRAEKLARRPLTAMPVPKEKPTTELQAWADLESIMCGDLSAMLGEAIVCRGEADQAPLFVSQIALTNADTGSTVSFRIGSDDASLARLASGLLQLDTCDDSIRSDLVGEMANTIGGAFQRCAAEEGENITLGLPRQCGRQLLDTPKEPSRTLVLVGAKTGVRVSVTVEVRSQRFEHLRPELLREGMVLTRDIVGDRGALLVAKGTRLTEVNAQRLARLLPPHLLVQVSFAA